MINYSIVELEEIIKRVSLKLGNSEIKEGSFLYHLILGLKEESDIYKKEVEETLLNQHIETCNEIYDSMYGNDLGLKRISAPEYTVLGSENIAYIEANDGSFFPQFLNNTKVLSKDSVINNGKITIKINNDVILNSLENKIFIDCTITSSEDTVISPTSSIRIDINNQYIQYLNFKVLQPIYFRYKTESQKSFKTKLLREIERKGKRDLDYIILMLKDIYGIKDIRYKNNGYDYIFYFTTVEMQSAGLTNSSAEYKRIIESELLSLLNWPNTFLVKEADRLDIHIKYSLPSSYLWDTFKIKEVLFKITYNLLEDIRFLNKRHIEKEFLKDYGQPIIIENIYFYDLITNTNIDSVENNIESYIYLNIDNIEENND